MTPESKKEVRDNNISFDNTFNGKKPIKTKIWLAVKKALKTKCKKCTNYRCYRMRHHDFINGWCKWCPISENEHLENRKLVNDVFKELEKQMAKGMEVKI